MRIMLYVVMLSGILICGSLGASQIGVMNGSAGWELGMGLQSHFTNDELEKKGPTESELQINNAARAYEKYVANMPGRLSQWEDELEHLRIAWCTDVEGDAKKTIEKNPDDMARVVPTLNYAFAHIDQTRAVALATWYRRVHYGRALGDAIRTPLVSGGVPLPLADLVTEYARVHQEIGALLAHHVPCVFLNIPTAKKGLWDVQRGGHTFVSISMNSFGGTQEGAVTSRCLHDDGNPIAENVFQKNHASDWQYQSVKNNQSNIFVVPYARSQRAAAIYHVRKGMCGRHSEMFCFRDYVIDRDCFAQETVCDHISKTHKQHLLSAWSRIKGSRELYEHKKERGRKEICFALGNMTRLALTDNAIKLDIQEGEEYGVTTNCMYYNGIYTIQDVNC